MKLHLRTLKNNPKVYTLLFILVLSLLFVTAPSIKMHVAALLKDPLVVLTFIKKEIRGLVFYHRTMVLHERLSREVGFLRQKLDGFQELREENERLRGLLSLSQETPLQVIAARVIGRSPDNFSSGIIIDKGYSHGIRKRFIAINHEGLVGKVAELSSTVSKIILINDPRVSVSAISQRSSQEGLVTGTLSGNLIMKYIPKEADILESDIITTAGFTKAYPKGIPIGTVVEVHEEFSGLSKYAVIKPAVKLSRIDEVLIVIP